MPNIRRLMMGVAAVAGDPELSGTMWAWGEGSNGQRGSGSNSDMSSPVQIGALTTWGATSGKPQWKNTAHAIKQDGTLWGWGYNEQGGQIGDGTVVTKNSPVQIGSLTTWSRAAGGNYHSIFLSTAGKLYATGTTFAKGATGLGNNTNYSSPVQIGSLTNWAYPAAAQYCSGCVKTDGTLWTWGAGASGQCGRGNILNISSPEQVGSLTNWSKLVMGPGGSSAAIKTDGTLWTWGSGDSGRLGDGTVVNKSSPVQVGSLTTWAYVSCAHSHTIAIKTDGTMWGWGKGMSVGYISGSGHTVNQSSPVQIGTERDWWRVSCTGESSSAVAKAGTLWSWGGGSNGVLGNGAVSNINSPIQIGTDTDWYDVAGGNQTMQALK